MLIHRANKYRSEPTAYQAQAMGQWVGATRFAVGIGLKQRIDGWRKAVHLDDNKQAKELTACREMADWLDFAPGHALPYAAMHLEDAFARLRSPQNEHPSPARSARTTRSRGRARMLNSPLNKNHGAIKLPT